MTSDEALLDSFQVAADVDLTEHKRAYEEDVARCMSEQGFDYFPVVPEALGTDSGPTDTEEWYATWGYGISIDTSQDTQPQETSSPDPNAEYVASLTDDGREAYDDALFGSLEPGEQPSGKPGELGCQLEASDALLTAEAVPEQPELVTELLDEVSSTLPGRIATDQRTREAADAQVACVVAAGGSDYDPLAGESAYDQVQSAYNELTAQGEPSAADLAAFQQWERDVAAAEFRCNAPVQKAAQDVRTDLVREVVAPHRAELEALAEQWSDR